MCVARTTSPNACVLRTEIMTISCVRVVLLVRMRCKRPDSSYVIRNVHNFVIKQGVHPDIWLNVLDIFFWLVCWCGCRNIQLNHIQIDHFPGDVICIKYVCFAHAYPKVPYCGKPLLSWCNNRHQRHG